MAETLEENGMRKGQKSTEVLSAFSASIIMLSLCKNISFPR